jgi:hypothetical protein
MPYCIQYLPSNVQYTAGTFYSPGITRRGFNPTLPRGCIKLDTRTLHVLCGLSNAYSPESSILIFQLLEYEAAIRNHNPSSTHIAVCIIVRARINIIDAIHEWCFTAKSHSNGYCYQSNKGFHYAKHMHWAEHAATRFIYIDNISMSSTSVLRFY